jgi:hypothetical protein
MAAAAGSASLSSAASSTLAPDNTLTYARPRPVCVPALAKAGLDGEGLRAGEGVVSGAAEPCARRADAGREPCMLAGGVGTWACAGLESSEASVDVSEESPDDPLSCGPGCASPAAAKAPSRLPGRSWPVVVEPAAGVGLGADGERGGCGARLADCALVWRGEASDSSESSDEKCDCGIHRRAHKGGTDRAGASPAHAAVDARAAAADTDNDQRAAEACVRAIKSLAAPTHARKHRPVAG